MKWVLAVVSLGIWGCVTAARPPVSETTLQDEGAVYVYLAPVPRDGDGLGVALKSLVAVGEGGRVVPLQLLLPAIAAAEPGRGERLLANGRLPPGRYSGLQVAVASASLAGRQGAPKLVVSEEPARIDVAFDVRSGQAVVVTLALDAKRSVQGGAEFTPRFTGVVPARTPPTLVGACSNTQTNDVTIFDTWTKAVTNVTVVGRSPYGLALEPNVARSWVALSGQDQLDVVDLSRAESVSKIPMRGGDEPRALQMLADRRTLLVANFRSQTASFVDAFTTQELARVPVGEAPWSITLQRGGNRAFVLNRRSNNMTIIDVATRQAIGSVPTDPEPLFGQVSRDGKRLYVIHAGSPYMTEFALPGMTVTRRIRVGLGASAIKLDSRTDLLYIGHEELGRLEVYDPFSAFPVDAFDLPGWVSHMAIDDPQDQLFALMPGLRAIAVIDLTSRRLISVIEVSGNPYEVKLAAERN
jgi:YVTN family beta-propeller protein